MKALLEMGLNVQKCKNCDMQKKYINDTHPCLVQVEERRVARLEYAICVCNYVPVLCDRAGYYEQVLTSLHLCS